MEDPLPTSVLLRRIKVAPSPNSIVDTVEAGKGRGRGRGGRLVRRRRRRKKKNIVSEDSASVSVYFAPL